MNFFFPNHKTNICLHQIPVIVCQNDVILILSWHDIFFQVKVWFQNRRLSEKKKSAKKLHLAPKEAVAGTKLVDHSPL